MVDDVRRCRFQTNDISQIKLGNVAEFHSYNWFGRPYDQLTADEQSEVTHIAQSFANGYGERLQAGKNPNIKPTLLWYTKYIPAMILFAINPSLLFLRFD
jgi:hypothetical protein